MKKPSPKVRSSSSKTRPNSHHPLVGTWTNTEPSRMVPVRYDHPLVGTWEELRNPVSVSSVAYEIAVVNGRFVVTGTDMNDKTKLEISDVRWDGTTLLFASFYPPTEWQSQHAIRSFKPGLIRHWVTYTQLEIWQKKTQAK